MRLANEETLHAADQPAKPPMAIVTGASSGIGRALAIELARRGIDLCLVARRTRLLEDLCSELMDGHGIDAHAFPVDLTEPHAPEDVFSHFQKIGREPDFLVNNAGIGTMGEFSSTDWNKEREILQLNILALTELTKLFVPGMKRRHFGRILNVASTAAFKPGPNYAVYAATKSYVLSLSQALHYELAGTGVSVTCLCPGPTQTAFAHHLHARKEGLFRRMRTMSASSVARHGVSTMLAGKSIAIPGSFNTAATLASQILPNQLMMRLTAAVRRNPVH